MKINTEQLKKSFIPIFLIAFFTLGVISCSKKSTQVISGDKVGYVDLGALFEAYAKVGKYDKEIEKLGKGKQDERSGLADEIRKTQDSLELLSEAAKEEKKKELEKQFQKLEEFDNKAREELTARRNDLLKEVFNDIEKVVQDYADANKYDMIFTSRSLIFKKDQYDVTKPVLRELNRRYEHQAGTTTASGTA